MATFKRSLVVILVAVPLFFFLLGGLSSKTGEEIHHVPNDHVENQEKVKEKVKEVTLSTTPARSNVPGPDTPLSSIPCGDVCRYDFTQTPGKFFPVIKKHFDCANLMKRSFLTRPATDWPPPREPPADQMTAFTQNGEMPISQQYYWAQRYAGGKANVNVWTEEMVEERIIKQRNREQIGGYGVGDEDNIRESMSRFPVTGKRGAVLGSESPWVEAIVLDKGATHVTTIEYGEIESSHPKIDTMVPAQAAEKFLRGELELFDFIYTYSSLEHSGLGRYGDSLNPYGDLEASAQAWCMLKPGGIFYLGLPVASSSHIRYNADRNYGPERMKHMASGFEQLDHVGGWSYQAIFVLRKPLEN